MAQHPVPLALALPQQTRRVREAVLPFWYFHMAPTGPGARDPAVLEYIQLMNAALTTADQAMMTQDLGLMQFAYRTLVSFTQVPAQPEPVESAHDGAVDAAVEDRGD